MGVDFFIDINDSPYSDDFLKEVLTFGLEFIKLDRLKELELLVRLEEQSHETDPVMGSCYGEGDSWVIEIDPNLSEDDLVETIFHEIVHLTHEGISDTAFKEHEAELYSLEMKRVWDEYEHAV